MLNLAIASSGQRTSHTEKEQHKSSIHFYRHNLLYSNKQVNIVLTYKTHKDDWFMKTGFYFSTYEIHSWKKSEYDTDLARGNGYTGDSD